MPCRPALFAACICIALCGSAAHAGIDALPQVEFSQLSQRDSTPLGAQALGLHADEWKHGETEHFIYHYQKSFVATAVSVEAEFHFRVIVQELGQEASAVREKAHIYIFERPEDWRAFQAAGQLEPWTGGIQAGGSLFIVRNPAYRFTDNSLGHEIVHLLLRRVHGVTIPLWLNEGFAQYVSKGAHASYLRARGYRAKPTSSGIETEKLLPLAALTTMPYPSADLVETFYDESERLVRFLVAADRRKFLDFLQLSARGERFDAAIGRAYGVMFRDTAQLEEQFRVYAAKDAGSPVAER